MIVSDNSPSDEDYVDITDDDYDADLDEIHEEDGYENEEEEIFSSDRKKKKSSLPVIVVIIIACILAGGAFLYKKHSDKRMAAIAQPPAPAITTLTQSTEAPQTQMVEQTPSIPASGMEPAPSENGKTSALSVPTSDTPPISAASPVPSIPGSAPTPQQSLLPAGPVAAQIPVPQTIVSPAPELSAQSPSQNVADTAKTTPPQVVPVTTQQPDQSSLAPVTDAKPAQSDTEIAQDQKAAIQPKKKDELEAARETIKAAPRVDEKTVYFDAPKGKALADMKPPSMNPVIAPGESIIIVHKQKDETNSGVIVEKGEDSGYIESKLVSANRAASLGRYDAALDFYNDLYKKNSHDPRILMGRAVALQRTGNTQKAIDAYQDVLEVDPNNPEATTNLMGLIGKTKPAVALQNLLDLREKYPKNAAVAAQLGVAYAQSGNSEDGLKYLNMAAGMEPANPLHYFNMAVISEHMNDRQNAILYYEKSLDAAAIGDAASKNGYSREDVYDRLTKLRGN